MLAARTAAIEHFRRRDVMNRSTDGTIRVDVQVSERRILLPDLVVWQRVIHDRVLCDFWNGDVLRDVVEVRAVVLPHQEELARVAEDGRTNAGLFETRVLLNN